MQSHNVNQPQICSQTSFSMPQLTVVLIWVDCWFVAFDNWMEIVDTLLRILTMKIIQASDRERNHILNLGKSDNVPRLDNQGLLRSHKDNSSHLWRDQRRQCFIGLPYSRSRSLLIGEKGVLLLRCLER